MAIELPVSPRMVEMNISNVCNLKCLTCVRNAPDYVQPKATFLELEQFETIMERFPKLEKLQICGFSEPTLNENLPEMVKSAKNAGVKHVEMFTNGTKLVGDMAERLASSGLDLLRVSIDGGDAETYRQVRGADLNEVTRNIQSFSQQSGIPIRMESVLSKYTADSAKKLPGVAVSMGAACLSIRLLDGQDHNLADDYIYDPTRLRNLKEKLSVSCKKQGIELVMALPGEEDFVARCTAWEEVYVDENGGLIPCYLLGARPVGNLLESTFEEIQSSRGPAFLDQMEAKGGFLDSCCCTHALVTQNKVK